MKKGHLTLVDGAMSHQKPRAPRRLSTDRQGQFQLELQDGDIRHILIVAMDAVHGSRVATAVEKTLPNTVVDLRQTLRFDQPGLSRTSFFDQLKRVRATYMREPVDWPHFLSPHLITDQRLPIRVYHEAVERWDGHVALLVSKAEHAQYLKALLNRDLSERRPAGWDILQVA